MRAVHLLGVGATSFSSAGRSAQELAREAIEAALADAGLAPGDIDAVTVATGGDDQDTAGLDVLGNGSRRRRFPPVCVSGATALHVGWQAVATGAIDVVLCVGHEAARPGARTEALEPLAAAASQYMESSGATEEHFARVAANSRAHGADNPRASLTTSVDAAAIMASDVLVWPLRRLMVAAPSEGAAAVVLACSDASRRRGARAPRVRASVLVRDGDHDVAGAIGRAARLGYEAAGLGPDEIDCAEIDDRTASGELAAYEALQFAPEGQGPELVDSGFTARGGVLPVNTSGGALARGDASGAAGIAQLCELAWQLRGQAERRQVAGARVGLALAGARDERDGALVALTILSAA